MSKLNDLVKKVIVGTAALSTFISTSDENTTDQKQSSTFDPNSDDSIVKQLPQVPQLIIKQSSGSDDFIIAQHVSHKSHKSHNSHRSHRSHYSHRSSNPGSMTSAYLMA